jgi:hypothetical protein
MTGCGKVRYESVKIDKALLECPDAPEIPVSPVTNEQDFIFKNDLYYAHSDCHSKLQRIKEIQTKK